MKTLTITEARRNLSGWIRRAKAGEDIGIIDGNQIIALRPVEVVAIDHSETAELLADPKFMAHLAKVKAGKMRYVTLEDVPE